MKFSFIIPCFNPGHLLIRCIESIMNQGLLDYEIILVDDGSTDNSISSVERYLNLPYIRILRQKNSGVSVARNNGLEIASGDYVFFIDADDYYVTDSFLEIEKKLESSLCDIIFFGYEIINDNNRHNDFNVIENIYSTELSNVKNEILEHLLTTKNNIEGYIWRCGYNRKFLCANNLKFANGIKISEDYLFLFECLICSNDILLYPKKVYCYFLNEDSVTKKFIPTLKYDMEYVNSKIEEKVKIFLPGLKHDMDALKANTFIRIIQNFSLNNNFCSTCKYASKVRLDYKKNLKIGLKQYNKFTIKTYFGIFLSYFHLAWLYLLIFKIKKKIT